MRSRAVPRPAAARTIQTAITQFITGKLETREHTPLGKHTARTGLWVSLAIMAMMPVIPAPIPTPRNSAGPLPDREDSAGEREPDELWPPACGPNSAKSWRTADDGVARMWHAGRAASDGDT